MEPNENFNLPSMFTAENREWYRIYNNGKLNMDHVLEYYVYPCLESHQVNEKHVVLCKIEKIYNVLFESIWTK